jgi:hypothetical protein
MDERRRSGQRTSAVAGIARDHDADAKCIHSSKRNSLLLGKEKK